MSTETTTGEAMSCPFSSLADINPTSLGRDYPHTEIEYIDISSVGSGIQSPPTKYQLCDAPGRARRLVAHGDTLLATVRPNLRSFLFVKRPSPCTVASTGFAVLRPKKGVAPRFVYYTVTNQGFTEYLTANAKGSAYPAVDVDTIKRAEVFCPPPSVQYKIAAVLSAYDDLIENNTRRIQILEEMAQALYREWFVHFRFPGHGQSKMVAAAVGQIPEGWRIGSLSDISDLAKQTVVPWKYPDETFAYYSFPAFDKNQMPALELGIDIKSNKNLITKPSILLSKMNPHIPRVWLTATNPYRAIASTEFLVLEPKTEAHRGTLYCLSCSNEFQRQYQVLSVGTSTSHQRIRPTDFMNLPVILPTASCRAEFEKHAAPILQECQNLRSRNSNLRQTRDLLLPKLISGEVDVDGLEIAGALGEAL